MTFRQTIVVLYECKSHGREQEDFTRVANRRPLAQAIKLAGVPHSR